MTFCVAIRHNKATIQHSSALRYGAGALRHDVQRARHELYCDTILYVATGGGGGGGCYTACPDTVTRQDMACDMVGWGHDTTPSAP